MFSRLRPFASSLLVRAPLVAAVGSALGTAGCSVETYSVAVDSTEVKQGSLVLRLDTSHSDGEDDVLRVVVRLGSPRKDECPELADDVRLILVTDAGETELDVEERGGGSYGVDCAIKCHDIVAFETTCSPVRAELRGEAVRALRSSSTMRVVLHDPSTQLGATIERSSFEPRSARIEEPTARVAPENSSAYVFAHVPFEWSHDDVGHWANEWADNFKASRDGDFSEFNLRTGSEEPDPEHPRRYTFVVRNTADRGSRTVYLGATAPVATCDLASCSGLEHVTAATISVQDE